MTEILPAYNHLGQVAVERGKQCNVNVYNLRPFSYPLADGEKQNIKLSYSLPERLIAPVLKNQEVGALEIYLGDKLLASDKVYAMDEVRSIQIGDVLRDMLTDMRTAL